MSPLLPPSSDALTTGMPADLTTLTRSGFVYWDAIAMSGSRATTSSGSNPITGTSASRSETLETSRSVKNGYIAVNFTVSIRAAPISAWPSDRKWTRSGGSCSVTVPSEDSTVLGQPKFSGSTMPSTDLNASSGSGVGVAVGDGVSVGSGFGVGLGVGVSGISVCVGSTGVAVGAVVGVTVGVGGSCVAVGAGVAVGATVGVGSGELHAMAANVATVAIAAMNAAIGGSARLFFVVVRVILSLLVCLC